MMLARLLAALLHLAPVHAGVGTIFGNGDGQLATSWACRYPSRREGQTVLSRSLEAAGYVVAHPKAPCWSIVIALNPRTLRVALATTGDRGPAKAAIDLWHTLGRALHHNGRELVYFTFSLEAA